MMFGFGLSMYAFSDRLWYMGEEKMRKVPFVNTAKEAVKLDGEASGFSGAVCIGVVWASWFF